MVDLRNVYDPVAMRQAGFDYHCVGRPGEPAARVILRQCPRRLPSPAWTITVCVCNDISVLGVSGRLPGRPTRRQTVAADRFDILVVDSASTGDAAEQITRMVRAVPNARLLRVEQPGVSRARNASVAAATGDYLAYIDDYAIAAPDWVARILAAIRRD